jgi:hypothetical protein
MVTRIRKVKVKVKTWKESLILDTKLYVTQFNKCIKTGHYEHGKMIFLNADGVAFESNQGIRLRDIHDFFNKQVQKTRASSYVKDNIRAGRLSAVDSEDLIIRYYPYIFRYTPEYHECKYSYFMSMVKSGHSTLFNALAKLYVWYVQNASSDCMVYYNRPDDLPYQIPHEGDLARLCTESSINELFVAILVFGQHIPSFCDCDAFSLKQKVDKSNLKRNVMQEEEQDQPEDEDEDEDQDQYDCQDQHDNEDDEDEDEDQDQYDCQDQHDNEDDEELDGSGVHHDD